MYSIFKKQDDHVMSWRQQWTIDNQLRRLIHPPDKIFAGLVKPGMTVLDLGCGTGTFTLDLARMVGEEGRVIGVDIQADALARLEEKTALTDLQRIVEAWMCPQETIGELPKADFALAFYMVHEVPDAELFFQRMHANLNAGGSMLVVEPPFHVRQKHFETEMQLAERAGFSIHNMPIFWLSHAALLIKG